MPNWCNNNLLIITGSSEEHRKMEKIINENCTNEDNFKMQWFHPRPESENWYEWHNENWGTKWDISGCSLNHALGEFKDSDYLRDDLEYGGRPFMEISFDTAWGPPLAFIVKMSELFPKTIFSIAFEEFGMDFAGVIAMRNKKVVFEKEWQPSDYAEEDDLFDYNWEFYYDNVPADINSAVDEAFSDGLPKFILTPSAVGDLITELID